MNLSMRQLRAVVHLAQLRSFTRAAERLFITQAGLSATVRELESELGFRLFERTTRSVSLTRAGQQFLPVAHRTLVELEQYVDFLKNRSFRRTLLVHAEATIARATTLEQLATMQLSGMCRPVSDEPDIHSAAATEEFRNDDEVSIETNKPVVKAALVLLHRLWPRPLPFGVAVGGAGACVGVTVASVVEPQ